MYTFYSTICVVHNTALNSSDNLPIPLILQTITTSDLQHYPFLGTGYPVAITRVPGPGFNF